MLSFTIDGQEYLFPAGYNDILLRDYLAFVEIVGLPSAQYQPNNPERHKSRLINRVKSKALEMRRNRLGDMQVENEAVSLEYMSQFLNFWGKIPITLIGRMLESDIFAMYVTINNYWLPFKPTEGITTFLHDGRLWSIDYSIDAVTSIIDPQNPQSIMAMLCVSQGGGLESSRYWGGVQLATAVSVIVEMKSRHKTIASAIGASIINAIEGKGAING